MLDYESRNLPDVTPKVHFRGFNFSCCCCRQFNITWRCLKWSTIWHQLSIKSTMMHSSISPGILWRWRSLHVGIWPSVFQAKWHDLATKLPFDDSNAVVSSSSDAIFIYLMYHGYPSIKDSASLLFLRLWAVPYEGGKSSLGQACLAGSRCKLEFGQFSS